jgi:cell division protein FtsI/penicillin-binding protein 2
MQQMMVGVVEHGSGFAARIDGFKNRIAGKTGTASIPENGKYLPDATIGSFVGFVPVDHPQFIMLVITRKPKVLFEGAYVAAPIWKTVASALITQWQIAP